jgi:hypothetical protein
MQRRHSDLGGSKKMHRLTLLADRPMEKGLLALDLDVGLINALGIF